MSKISRFFSVATAVGVLSVTSMGPALAAQQDAMSDAQWMERMQSHWQQVIHETDAQKRRELMREHEQIMAQAEGSVDSEARTSAASGAGHMGMDGSHVDMMNTVEMHRHMIDMMR